MLKKRALRHKVRVGELASELMTQKSILSQPWYDLPIKQYSLVLCYLLLALNRSVAFHRGGKYTKSVCHFILLRSFPLARNLKGVHRFETAVAIGRRISSQPLRVQKRKQC